MKSKNLLYSFKYAIEGIKTAFISERNLKIHTFVTILVIILGIIFKISPMEWVACILIIAMVVGCELINTSIEEVVNLLSPEKRIHAKKAKDIAAGAVFVFAIASVIIAGIIFIPKIF